ncbi:MAG: phospho-N-acetylmuramoyl-pentapeptide-transferase [Planctomycetota bacterium]|nr:phospho-N-acetylmuramoyl-pentapeptide-transferase [Planctomycetota bacterium]
MLYLLLRNHLWLEAHHIGFLRVFNDVTFQSTVAVILSFALVMLLGPRTIRWLRLQKIGDAANFDQAQMNELMRSKVGTPTMGGILIIFSIALTTLLLADLSNFYVRMAVICLVWLGALGAVDDWLKLTTRRRAAALPPGGQISRQGLTSLEKILFQIGLGVLLSFFTYYYSANVTSHTLYFPFFKNLSLRLAPAMFILVGTVVLTGTSNAVNLTDGLDGLAAGCSAIVSFTFLILALIQGYQLGSMGLAQYLFLPQIPNSAQMAVIAGSMVGACLGFLWFNCNPAAVFMGDTGSLALGGLLGYIAIVIRQELLLVLCGGIFVAEAMSVILQVGWFKYTRRKYGEGRRIFLMSPLHHHFQKKGWAETQVVIRFWLIGAMLAMVALATIKLR